MSINNITWAQSLKITDNMEDYQRRMLDEFIELNSKTMKLGVFIDGETFKTLPCDEQRDMYDQYHAMLLYKSCLLRRIKRADLYGEIKSIVEGDAS